MLGAPDAGASGFILKTTPPGQLVPPVLAAAAGTAVLSLETLGRLRRRASAVPAPPDPRPARLMTHLDCTNRAQLALLAARSIG